MHSIQSVYFSKKSSNLKNHRLNNMGARKTFLEVRWKSRNTNWKSQYIRKVDPRHRTLKKISTILFFIIVITKKVRIGSCV